MAYDPEIYAEVLNVCREADKAAKEETPHYANQMKILYAQRLSEDGYDQEVIGNMFQAAMGQILCEETVEFLSK